MPDVGDALLDEPGKQEGLSCAYVQAVAASAGYVTKVPDVDRDSVDVTISAGGRMRPSLDLQLKATINLRALGDGYSFPLPIKNYNDLRAETQTPRILVVLDMPTEREHWLSVSVDELIIRKSAYWMSLRGLDESTNTTSVTVHIPQINYFDVNGLIDLMNRSRTGTI